jgi:O-antigen ligase
MMSLATLRRYAARALTPAFLAFALLVGGASLEGDFLKAVLFALSGALLAGLFLFAGPWWKGPVAVIPVFAGLLAVLLVVQVVPLPPGWVGDLPVREAAGKSLEALGLEPGPAALSLAPEATVAGLLAFLAPFCGFALVAAVKWSRGAGLLKWAIPALGAASAALGLAQVILGKAMPELYFYDFTALGLPVGVFSNPNHQASFLLMCLPFVAVLAADLRRDWEGSDEDAALSLVAGVLGLMILAGILGAGSAAGYLLLVPVLVLSLAAAFAGRRKSKDRAAGGRLAGLAIAAMVLGFAALVVFTSPRLTGLGYTSFEDGPASRIGINRVSAVMIEDHWAAGTGLGAYQDVYRLYEDPDTVSRVFIAHAHNDYYEWVIETGLAGSVLLGAFLLAWSYWFLRLWTGSRADALRLRRAASIACLVPVLHSLVDYPLRTPGIAVLAAMCLALMIVPRQRSEAPLPEAEQSGDEELRTVTL